MSNTNSKDLRAALARAIKFHCEANGLNGVSGGKLAGIANSRMSQILRGDVDKISSDALVDIAGSLGYRLTSVIGSNDGHEFTLMPYEKGEWEKLDVGLEGAEEVELVDDEMIVVGKIIKPDDSDFHNEVEVDFDADRVIADA